MYIKVRAETGAKKESLVALNATTFTITTKEKAEQNAANRRILELVAAHFKINTKEVRLVRGHRSPAKLLLIPDAQKPA